MRIVLNLILFVAWIAATGALVLSLTDASQLRADREALERDAREVYQAFEVYHRRHGEFPDPESDPNCRPGTLDPLRRRGYYDGVLTRRLLEGRIDGYGAPDDRGQNQEFWVELTLASDPTVRYLVARSDDAPLGGGTWHDGVYALRNGRLERR